MTREWSAVKRRVAMHVFSININFRMCQKSGYDIQVTFPCSSLKWCHTNLKDSDEICAMNNGNGCNVREKSWFGLPLSNKRGIHVARWAVDRTPDIVHCLKPTTPRLYPCSHPGDTLPRTVIVKVCRTKGRWREVMPSFESRSRFGEGTWQFSLSHQKNTPQVRNHQISTISISSNSPTIFWWRAITPRAIVP